MMGARLANLKGREKAGIVVIAAILAMVVVYNLAARGLMRRVKDIGLEIEAEKRNLLDYQRAVDAAPQVRADFERVRERFEPAASPAVVQRTMKEQINEAAVRSGLKIAKMEDRDRRPGKFCDEYVVEIASFEGDETSVLRFIDELWSSRGMPRVVRLTLAPNPGQGTGMVKGSMLITEAVESWRPSADATAEKPQRGPG